MSSVSGSSGVKDLITGLPQFVTNYVMIVTLPSKAENASFSL